MKLLILHFSDMHIKNEEILNIKTRLLNYIKSLGVFDDCLIIFSGDISSDGTYYHYETAAKFIGFFKKNLGINSIIKNKIEIAVVPGNHDINHNGGSRSRLEVKSLVLDPRTENITSEINKLENFYRFARLNNSFINDQIIDIKQLQFTNYDVSLVLINSSLFSSCRDVNEDEDKGLHFIPDESINKYDFTKLTGYKIFISHYPMSWMTWDSSSKSERKIHKYIDFVFTGHEHKSSIYSKDLGNGKNIIYSEGGAFDKNNDYMFSYFILDTESNKVQSNVLKYYNDLFISTLEKEKEFELKSKGHNFTLQEEFLKRFFYDEELMVDSFLDYFVFPRLYQESLKLGRENNYLSFNSFSRAIENFNIINIFGESSSGKTTLGKYLFDTYYKNNYIPLFLEKDDLYGKNKTEKIVQDKFFEQYGNDKYQYERFKQLDQSNKILIIDGVQNDEDFEKIENIISDYSKVFFLIDGFKTFDLKQMLQNINVEEEESINFRITPFYVDKRNELIDNVCNILNKNGKTFYNDDTVNLIKKFLSNDISFFSYYPKHIIIAIRMYSNSSIFENKNASIFEEYFNTDISEKLLRYVKNKELVKPALAILKKLAYTLNKKKKYPFDYNDMVLQIEQYNEKYDYSFKIHDIINVWLDAKIIKNLSENKFRFYSKNYYSYLIASELNSRILTGEGLNELFDITKNVHKYINDDILLFFLCITDNETVLIHILTYLTSYFEEYKEFEFANSNYSFLRQTLFDRIYSPEEEDKEKHQDLVVKKEEEQIQKTEQKNGHDIYCDKEAEEIMDNFSKMISYLKISSRILPNFNYMLEKKYKKGFIELIYRIPNKILYYFFDMFEKYYDEVISDVHDNINKYGQEKITRKDVEKLFDSLFQLLIYTLYYISMQYAVDGQTKKMLTKNSVIDESYNHVVQRLFVFANDTSVEDFMKEFSLINDETKNITIKAIIKILAYNVFINYKGKETSSVISFKNKVFTPKEKREMIAKQAFTSQY